MRGRRCLRRRKAQKYEGLKENVTMVNHRRTAGLVCLYRTASYSKAGTYLLFEQRESNRINATAHRRGTGISSNGDEECIQASGTTVVKVGHDIGMVEDATPRMEESNRRRQRRCMRQAWQTTT